MANYDYVVVGAGSAGCVVAARLSEDAGIHVAVLEAGSRQVPPRVAEDIAIPWHWGLVQNTPVDWGYLSVPQPHCCGRRFPEPRGRMPGGTSNLYILMHIRGHRSDYDNWAYNGCPGWSFDDVLPYFQKLEDQEDDTNPLAGKGGPLRVASVERHDPNPVSQAFIDACVELGFAKNRRLQRSADGGCRMAPRQHQGRQAAQRRGRLPLSGAGQGAARSRSTNGPWS